MNELQDLQDSLGDWSDKTFGFDRKPSPCLHHLKKEVDELIDEPYDLMEYADCLHLFLDAARLARIDAHLLITAGFKKLEINKQREWGEPDENGVVQHIK